MLTPDALTANFYPVDALGDGIYRCGDELPKKTVYSYFLLCGRSDRSPFLVSDTVRDDDFARLVLWSVGCGSSTALTKTALPGNGRGFTHVLAVPAAYHAELKGRLGADRAETSLCIPIYDAEFSGTESVEEFIELRRNVVPTTDLDRRIAPKIVLRFDNPRTGGGTGDGYVFAKFDLIERELASLSGVPAGFLEILNHRDAVVEIVYDHDDTFAWIPDRDDDRREALSRDVVHERLWSFLTS